MYGHVPSSDVLSTRLVVMENNINFLRKITTHFHLLTPYPKLIFCIFYVFPFLSEAPFIKQISSWKSTPKHMNIRQILRVFFRETKFQQIFKWNLVLTLFSMADPQKAG